MRRSFATSAKKSPYACPSDTVRESSEPTSITRPSAEMKSRLNASQRGHAALHPASAAPAPAACARVAIPAAAHVIATASASAAPTRRAGRIARRFAIARAIRYIPRRRAAILCSTLNTPSASSSPATTPTAPSTTGCRAACVHTRAYHGTNPTT